MRREPFLMMYADWEEWYMITFSQVPLLASHQHLQIPNKAPLPRHDSAFFSVCVKEEQRTHVHLDYLINLFFLWFQKKRGGGDRENMGTVSHRQRGRDDTQISNSRETKSDDLDISLRRNASRLFSQLKNRVRQTGGERKNKNRIIRRGNRHFEFPVICQIYPQLHLLTGFCVCCGWEELRCDSLYCFAVRPDERQTTNLGHLF